MRKLLMLVVVALAAMAFAGASASPASATFKLFTPDLEEFCPGVSLDGSEVSGGCRADDFEGGFQIGAFLPGWTIMGNYDVGFDLVVDENGDGYAVDQTVSLDGPGLSRKPCDEANGTVLPWAVSSYWQDWFELKVDITVGLRPGTAAPGGACTQQVITVDATDIGGGSPTELEQLVQSANIRDGHFESPNDIWIDWDGSYGN
jgi:hypothetical protein